MSDVLPALPRYEAYKDSGVEWIGEIPLDWTIEPIMALLAERNEKNDPIKTDNILSLTMDRGVIPYSEKGLSGNKAKEDLTAYKLAYPGDIVLNSMNVIAGSVGLSKYFGAVSPVYYMLYPRKKEDVISYFDSIFQNEAFQKSLIGLGNGILIKKSASSGKLNTIRMRIPMSRLNRVCIPYPKPSQQTAIAAFLDCKTSKIDRAVAIKKKQIQLLKEHKQILIQTAVTKGLDSNVPMRHPGIDWIGEIPSHWDKKRFKNFFSQSRLPTRPNDGVVTSYRDGQVTLRSNRRLDGYTEAVLEQGYQGIRKGQLVLNSMDAFEGAIGVSDSDGKCTPEYVICDPISNELLPEYFAYLLREMALKKYIQVICNAVRQRAVRIRYNNLVKRFLIVPPFDEQTAIVAHIRTQSAKIDKAVAVQEQMIARLREYKSVLINAAVTGKIRVPVQTPEKVVT
jgi:type I restriction enzyme S subunit